MFGDGPNATIYGLADRFTGVTPCCTANFNQAWPKLVMSTVMETSDPTPTIVVAIYAPVRAELPPAAWGVGAYVDIVTDYPFGDNVAVTIAGTAKGGNLRLRIPGWATHANVSVNGDRPAAVAPMQYFTVPVGVGTTAVRLNLNPEVRVETGWGEAGYNSAVVTRGPLLFALGLDESYELLHSPWACFASGCSTDQAVRSKGEWAYSLVLPPGADGQPTSKAMVFTRSGPPDEVPFGSGGSSVTIKAQARRVFNWTMDARFPTSAAHPPVSPLACTPQDCGDIVPISLVPFGATRLRVGMFPWTLS